MMLAGDEGEEGLGIISNDLKFRQRNACLRREEIGSTFFEAREYRGRGVNQRWRRNSFLRSLQDESSIIRILRISSISRIYVRFRIHDRGSRAESNNFCVSLRRGEFLFEREYLPPREKSHVST